MSEAKLYGQNRAGATVNGRIKQCYVTPEENILSGDLVEYVNSTGEGIQVRKVTTGLFYGVVQKIISRDANKDVINVLTL